MRLVPGLTAANAAADGLVVNGVDRHVNVARNAAMADLLHRALAPAPVPSPGN